MPNLRSPRSASPDSFRRTRLYFAAVIVDRVWLNLSTSSRRPARSRSTRSSRINRSSLDSFRWLFAEREALEATDRDVLSGLHRESGDEVLHRLRRVADVRLREQLIDVLGRHGRDLHRDLLRQLLELLTARDEVGLARDLHDRADTSAGVYVRG